MATINEKIQTAVEPARKVEGTASLIMQTGMLTWFVAGAVVTIVKIADIVCNLSRKE